MRRQALMLRSLLAKTCTSHSSFLPLWCVTVRPPPKQGTMCQPSSTQCWAHTLRYCVHVTLIIARFCFATSQATTEAWNAVSAKHPTLSAMFISADEKASKVGGAISAKAACQGSWETGLLVEKLLVQAGLWVKVKALGARHTDEGIKAGRQAFNQPNQPKHSYHPSYDHLSAAHVR